MTLLWWFSFKYNFQNAVEMRIIFFLSYSFALNNADFIISWTDSFCVRIELNGPTKLSVRIKIDYFWWRRTKSESVRSRVRSRVCSAFTNRFVRSFVKLKENYGKTCNIEIIIIHSKTDLKKHTQFSIIFIFYQTHRFCFSIQCIFKNSFSPFLYFSILLFTYTHNPFIKCFGSYWKKWNAKRQNGNKSPRKKGKSFIIQIDARHEIKKWRNKNKTTRKT